MKTGEIRSTSAERLSGFRPEEFTVAPGSQMEVAFYENGKWQVGNLEETPRVENGKIVLSINGAEIFINMPPRRLELGVGSEIMIDGKKWKIKAVNFGSNGEVLYDLQSGRSKLNNVDQKYLHQIVEIERAQEVLESADGIAKLVEKVKKIKGEKRTELMDRIAGLNKQIAEMRSVVGGVEEWRGGNVERIQEIEAKVKELQNKIEREIQVLENDLSSVEVAEQQIDSENREITKERMKKESAAGYEIRVEKKVKDLDKEKPENGESWNDKQARFQDWKDKMAEIDNGITKINQQIRDQIAEDRKNVPFKKDAPRPPESQKLRILREKLRDAERAKKTWEGKKPAEPGKRPSEKPEARIQAWVDVYLEEKSTKEVGAGGPDYDSFLRASDFFNEVTKRRKQKAAAEHEGEDFPEWSERWDEVTAEMAKAVVDEWKKKEVGVEKKLFDFEREKSELQAKVAALEAQVVGWQGEGASILLNKLKIIKKGDHTAQPYVSGLEDLNKNVVNLEEEVINVWNMVLDLENTMERIKGRMQIKEREKTVETKIEIVDLPIDLMKDIIRENSEGLHMAMEAAFDAVMDNNGDISQVQIVVGKFFKNLNVDIGTPSLRQRLAERGVLDWEKFVKQFEKKLAEKFTGVLIQSVDSEVRYYIAKQAPTTLMEKFEQFKAYGKKVGWGKMATKIGVNTAVLAGAGVGAAFLGGATGVTGAAAGATTGGILGTFRVGLQRLFGRDTSKIKKAEDQARKDLEREMRASVRGQILENIFDTSGGKVTVKNDGSRNLAYALAATLRELTQSEEVEEDKKVKIKFGSEEVVLEGDDVCLYYEALKRASQDEGLELTEETKYRYAAALFALRNNKEKTILVEKTPAGIRALKWFTEAFSGKTTVAAEKRPAGAAVRVAGGEMVPAETKVSLSKQLAVTSVTGAAVGWALSAGGALSRASFGVDIARGAMGLAFGGLMGSSQEFSRQQREVAKEMHANLDTVITKCDGYVDALRAGTLSGGDLKEAKSYFTLFSAMLSGKGVEARALAGVNDKDMKKFFVAHSFDSAYFIQQNLLYKNTLRNLVVEMNRFGLLEMDETNPSAKSFKNALEALRQSGDQIEDEAKNSLGLRAKNFVKQFGRGAAYGVAMGGAAALVGAVMDVYFRGGGLATGRLRAEGETVFTNENDLNQWMAAQDAKGAAHMEELAAAASAASAKVAAQETATAGVENISTHETAVNHDPSFVKESLATVEIKKGGSAWGSIDSLKDDLQGKGLIDANGHVKGTDMNFAEWRRSELERLGYKFLPDGKVAHPFRIHSGASTELYVGGDGLPHARLVGVENGKVEVLDEYVVSKTAARAKLSIPRDVKPEVVKIAGTQNAINFEKVFSKSGVGVVNDLGEDNPLSVGDVPQHINVNVEAAEKISAVTAGTKVDRAHLLDILSGKGKTETVKVVGEIKANKTPVVDIENISKPELPTEASEVLSLENVAHDIKESVATKLVSEIGGSSKVNQKIWGGMIDKLRSDMYSNQELKNALLSGEATQEKALEYLQNHVEDLTGKERVLLLAIDPDGFPITEYPILKGSMEGANKVFIDSEASPVALVVTPNKEKVLLTIPDDLSFVEDKGQICIADYATGAKSPVGVSQDENGKWVLSNV